MHPLFLCHLKFWIITHQCLKYLKRHYFCELDMNGPWEEQYVPIRFQAKSVSHCMNRESPKITTNKVFIFLTSSNFYLYLPPTKPHNPQDRLSCKYDAKSKQILPTPENYPQKFIYSLQLRSIPWFPPKFINTLFTWVTQLLYVKHEERKICAMAKSVVSAFVAAKFGINEVWRHRWILQCK